MTEHTDAKTDRPDAGAPVRTVLFVCTGNTCRSPMALAIAEALLRADDAAPNLFIASAGVGAMEGAPPTPDALDALDRLGVELHEHVSTPLTAPMVEKADLVFGLTSGHVAAIEALAPASMEKVALLDPDGRDVPDPIGQGPQMYLETARRLRTLVARRLRELGVRVDEEALT